MQEGLVAHKLIAVTCRSMPRSQLGVGFIGIHMEGMSADDKLAVSQAILVSCCRGTKHVHEQLGLDAVASKCTRAVIL